MVDVAARARIAAELAPVSEGHLDRLLRQCGVPLQPLVEGVRQSSFDDLERTLLALAGEYAGMPRECRRLVIRAKDHARLALRRLGSAEAAAGREEMILWMLTWLENPEVFPVWVRLRRARLAGENATESRSSAPE